MICSTLTLLCPPPCFPLMWGQDTHITGRDDTITPSANHCLPDLDEPPVQPGARGMAHYGLQALLEHFGNGTVGWGESSHAGSQPVPSAQPWLWPPASRRQSVWKAEETVGVPFIGMAQVFESHTVPWGL